MKWNVRSVSSGEMKWNERFPHFSPVDVKWKLMKLFFREIREMRWNEVQFMKFMKFSETRWERAVSAIVSLFGPPGGVAFSYLVIIKSMTQTVRTNKRFIEFYQKSVFVKLSVFQT